MVRTIRELAEEYTKMEHGSYKIGAISDFTAGAIAVVNEIEQCLPNTPFANPYEVIDIIASKIKELKKE